MKTRIDREFKRLRKLGWAANAALRQAKTLDAFKFAEFEGLVRLSTLPDETACMADLKGEMFNPKVNTDIPRERLEKEEKEFEDRVERMGVVGIVGEYRLNEDAEWEHGESVWGFVGDDWKDSGSDADVMDTTLKALADAQALACPYCHGTGKKSA